MRLAFVCPQFPPDPGGVSDYVARLSSELASGGQSVQVWTATPSPAPLPGVGAQSFPGTWNLARFREIESSIREWNPEALVIQFTPYLYGPKSRGLCPALVLWIQGLGVRLGCPVALMVHELHYPVGLSPDKVLVGVPQWLQFLALVSVADRVWFTNEVSLKRMARHFPRKASRMAWLPVGATIEPPPLTPPPPPGVRPEEKILLQFGSGHPSRLFHLSFEALREAAAKRKAPTRLVFVGMSAAQVAAKLRDTGSEDLASIVQGLGFLRDEEVSAWLSRADVVLAPFIDGISTRRSSAMAALAHGRPLVTTRGYLTDPSIPWDNFCKITPLSENEGFKRNVGDCLQSPETATSMGVRARASYEKYFAWPLLTRKLLAALATP